MLNARARGAAAAAARQRATQTDASNGEKTQQQRGNAAQNRICRRRRARARAVASAVAAAVAVAVAVVVVVWHRSSTCGIKLTLNAARSLCNMHARAREHLAFRFYFVARRSWTKCEISKDSKTSLVHLHGSLQFFAFLMLITNKQSA